MMSGWDDHVFGNLPGVAANIVQVPVSEIEHGESAMPGGKLTWSGAQSLIRNYAAMPTPIPPIEALPPDGDNPKWMVYDGSHRLEAAKLRGDTHIGVRPVGVYQTPPRVVTHLGSGGLVGAEEEIRRQLEGLIPPKD